MKLTNEDIYPAPVTHQDHMEKLREFQALKWPELTMRGQAEELTNIEVYPTMVLRFVARGSQLLNNGVIYYKNTWMFLAGKRMTTAELIEHLNTQGWRWASLN